MPWQVSDVRARACVCECVCVRVEGRPRPRGGTSATRAPFSARPDPTPAPGGFAPKIRYLILNSPLPYPKQAVTLPGIASRSHSGTCTPQTCQRILALRMARNLALTLSCMPIPLDSGAPHVRRFRRVHIPLRHLHVPKVLKDFRIENGTSQDRAIWLLLSCLWP